MYDEAFSGKSLMDYLVIFNPEQRINVLYLASAFLLALVSYLSFRFSDEEEKPDLKDGFLAYVFPKKVWLHKSAVQDYAFAIVNAFVYYVIIVQGLIGAHAAATVMYHVFNVAFGKLDSPLLVSGYSKVLFTACSILAVDFALFWQHHMMHKIPVLWHFHKVHHSAEVLTPVTLYRMHPLDLAMTGVLAAAFGGTIYGLFWYLTGNQPEEYVVLGMNIVIFLFYVLGYNLRHSQIWFNYPAWLSHILVSPAQHQVHHSTSPAHFDKNMGVIFSFWDKLFGTLYVPKKYEKLDYGINKKEPNPFHSVWDLYVAPFKWAWASLKNEADRRSLFPVVMLFVMVVGFLGLMNYTMQARALPSVQVEELTWIEIKQAMDSGVDTVIIPTGGTEQGGPRVVEGKHNYIVHYTADKIARQIGGALVAPVLAYVPQGPVSPPESNMVLPGTVTVPEDVFEKILRSAAESYIQHGFKHVFFIGEHGLSQKAQAKVAIDLSKTWAKKGVSVVQIGDYYDKNGQIEWLKSEGYTERQIGVHAGIRDTSEVLFVHPDGVRNSTKEPGNDGSDGDWREASKAIGKKMIELKIDAAVKQIVPYLKDRK